MSIDKEDKKALIGYRLEKADMALDDAAFLTDAGKYGLAANRLYYALYYAASALSIESDVTYCDFHSFQKTLCLERL